MSDYQHYCEKVGEEIVDYVNSLNYYEYLSVAEPIIAYVRDRGLDGGQDGDLEGIILGAYWLGKQHGAN